MTKVKGEWLSSRTYFTLLNSLDNNTEYVFRAYVSNGVNEILSDIGYFLVAYADDSISLPYHSIDIGPYSEEFSMEVGGSAEFAVSFSSDVYWMSCQRKDRKCTFRVDNNPGPACSGMVSFRNLRNGQCDTLAVYQSSENVQNGVLPFDEIVLHSGNSEFTINLMPEYELGGIDYESKPRGWLSSWFEFNYFNFRKFVSAGGT